MTPPTLMDRLEAVVDAAGEAMEVDYNLEWFPAEDPLGKRHHAKLDMRRCRQKADTLCNLIGGTRPRLPDADIVSRLVHSLTLANQAETMAGWWGLAAPYTKLREAVEAALQHASKRPDVHLVATVPGHLRETFNKAPSAEFYVHAFVAKDLALELERTGEGCMHVVRDARHSMPDVSTSDLLDYPLDEGGEWLLSL